MSAWKLHDKYIKILNSQITTSFTSVRSVVILSLPMTPKFPIFYVYLIFSAIRKMKSPLNSISGCQVHSVWSLWGCSIFILHMIYGYLKKKFVQNIRFNSNLLYPTPVFYLLETKIPSKSKVSIFFTKYCEYVFFLVALSAAVVLQQIPQKSFRYVNVYQWVFSIVKFFVHTVLTVFETYVLFFKAPFFFKLLFMSFLRKLVRS